MESPNGNRPAARVVEVTKVYGEGDAAVHALDGVSLDFDFGGFSAIMGPSGSGKSTLLHCMAGLDRPTSGNILIGDTDLTLLNEKELTLLRRNSIGFIFQAYNLLPTLTASENIQLPVTIARGTPDRSRLADIVKVLGLDGRLDHRPSELSGGEQQRVAAARALFPNPRVIFADEPTGNLDSKTGTQLLEFMRQSVDELGQTIVMVTHDAHAAAFADRVVFLGDGKVIDDLVGPTYKKLLDRMKQLGD
jgi:putative ABC transport system ATP-binding protein